MRTWFRSFITIGAAVVISTITPREATADRHRGSVQLPVYFEPTPAGDSTAFVAKARGYVAHFDDRRILLTWPRATSPVSMELVGGVLTAPRSLQPLAGRVNYFVGAPGTWRTDVPTFGRLRYDNVYRGIDVEFYPNEGSLEYDFIVAPGADASKIRLAFHGGTLRLTREGDLVLHADGSQIVQPAPVIYQEIDGKRRTVAGRYRLAGRNGARFEIGTYDRSRPLIIDPTLMFSSYFPGGGRDDRIVDLAIDAAGFMYVVGYTRSDDLATPGAYRTTKPPLAPEMFVAKVEQTAEMSRLIYATYLGGASNEDPTSIAVDGSGNAYVAGYTISTDYPTTANAYDRLCGDDGTCRSPTGGTARWYDGFITKLNATGSALIYSTYIGGTDQDQIWDLGVDGAGRAHVVGSTLSTNYPVTAGAFVGAHPGGSNGFHSTLNASGTALAYSTYLGGSSSDSALGIAVAADGSRVVVGSTGSSNFPMVAPVDPTNPGGLEGFAVSFGPTATVRYSTFVGNDGLDFAVAVATGTDGSAYVLSETRSPDYPNVRQYGPFNQADVLVMKLSPDGQQIVYTTLVGGSTFEGPNAIAVDGQGRAFVTGATYSPDYPTTADAFQRTAPESDVFFLGLAPNGELYYSTILGGRWYEEGFAIVDDGRSGIVIAGVTHSRDFPANNGRAAPGEMPADGSVGESFITRFLIESLPPPPGGGDTRELVLYAHRATTHGNWSIVIDAGAANARAARNPNAGAAKVAAPLASPANYIELTFNAEAGVPYRLWLRGKAAGDHWTSDSVYVQFSDSVDASGGQMWRIGSTSGTTVQVERCNGCGLRGWGWNDNGYGSSATSNDQFGALVTFATNDVHTIRIQTREDGITIDQIVLSAQRYLSAAPGAAKDDTTILDENTGEGGGGEDPPACGPGEVVLHGADGITAGGWIKEADTTAASGIRVRQPDAGAAKVESPAAAPANYVDLTFQAEAGVDYRLWIRGKADSNHWKNDSAFVQFSDSVNASGGAQWRIGSTSATTYVLENCTGCAMSAWGWNDNEYGGSSLGAVVRFAANGEHRIRIQTREDGLSIDQVVLSAARYFSEAPGGVRNDATILNKCNGPSSATR